MRDIEIELREALTKNPLTRNRMVIEILQNDIRKCVFILLKRIRRSTRMYDVDDLIQEASISILMVLDADYLSNIKCQIRTYLLGTVKRTVWGIMRKESRIKRQAQNSALPIEYLETLSKRPNGEVRFQLQNNVPDTAEKYSIQDSIIKIKQLLKYPENEIFKDLMDGYSVKEVASIHSINLQTVYTMIRRIIKPLAKKILEIK